MLASDAATSRSFLGIARGTYMCSIAACWASATRWRPNADYVVVFGARAVRESLGRSAKLDRSAVLDDEFTDVPARLGDRPDMPTETLADGWADAILVEES